MAKRIGYERDEDTFPAEYYTVQGHGGIAWSILGWETEPDEDTEWSGCENRTGRIVCVMVGDDRRWTFDPEDVSPVELDEDETVCGCGQLGCRWG